MAGGWVSQLTEDLKKSPVLSNAGFSFVLVGLQKLAEMHFECPCYGLLSNKLFSSLFFVIPAFMSYLLMVVIKDRKFDDLLDVFSTFVPSFVWWMLLSLDGRYVSCAKTEWEGRYVVLDKAGPLRWCEPKTFVNCTLNNGTTLARRDCMLLSQWYYVQSQMIGLIPLTYVCGALVIYLTRRYKDWCCSCKEEDPPTSNGQLNRTEEMKEININLDVYEFILRKKGLSPGEVAQQGLTTGDVALVGNGAQELLSLPLVSSSAP